MALPREADGPDIKCPGRFSLPIGGGKKEKISFDGQTPGHAAHSLRLGEETPFQKTVSGLAAAPVLREERGDLFLAAVGVHTKAEGMSRPGDGVELLVPLL